VRYALQLIPKKLARAIFQLIRTSLDQLWLAMKAIALNYDFDIDKILASAKVRAGAIRSDDGKDYAEVWIEYQVFEAHVEMPITLYQQDDAVVFLKRFGISAYLGKTARLGGVN
jgi:hypothetical protein